MTQHDILVDQFERYLAGEASPELHEHLRVCRKCREEAAAMAGVAELLHETFRAGIRESAEESAVQPSLGFYSRVADRIVSRERPFAWGLFSPGVDFFRRVAFASLLMLAALGTFLVTREASEGGTDAVSIMAQHDFATSHTVISDRDNMLVTLANYRE